MKDIFNRRQRFSLRKYSFGVASVLLGTALFAAHTAQADEVVAPMLLHQILVHQLGREFFKPG